MAMSLFEADMCAGRHPGRYPHRTFLLLREQVLEVVPADKNAIDRHLRVVFDGNGPRPVSARAAVATETLRRVGNILYTRQFGERLLRELLLSRDGLRTSLNRLQGHFLMSGNLLGYLMPKHPKSMWGVVEDILLGPSVKAWCVALTEFAFRHGEFRVLSADGTVKIALALKGYKRNIFKTSYAKAHVAWKQSELLSRVLTVGGTTGYVLGAVPIRDEKGSIFADTLAQLVDSRRQCVENVSVDFATKELHDRLSLTFHDSSACARKPCTWS